MIAQKTAYLSLQPGDPWTFIYDAPIADDSGKAVRVGDQISKWFATNESGRLFRITAIHAPGTYETAFVGFCPM